MKKKIIVGLNLVVIILLLSACNKSIPHKGDKAETVTTNDSYSPANYEFPNKEALNQKLATVFDEIGISELIKTDIINYSPHDDGDIDVDLIITTDLKALKINCYYMSMIDSWNIISVINNENQLDYYVTPGAKGTVDIYDYSTDSLLTKSDPSSSTRDIMADYSRSFESMDESYDAAVESIMDKYNK